MEASRPSNAQKVGGILLQHISVAVGLACFLSWVVIHDSIFQFQRGPALLGGLFEYGSFSVVTNAAILLLLFFLYLKMRLVPLGYSWFLFIGLSLFAGYELGLLIDSSEVGDPAFSWLLAIHILLTNLGMAALSLEWIRLLGCLGVVSSTWILVAAAVASSFFVWLSGVTDFLAASPLSGVFPLASLGAIVLFYKRSDGNLLARLKSYGNDSDLSIPYGLLATVFFSDFVGAAVLTLAYETGIVSGATFNAVTFFLSAIALVLSAGVFRMDFNNIIYKLAYVLMALGCVILALPFLSLSLGGLVVQQTGYRLMLFVTYLLSVWLIANKRLSANWVYPVVTGVAFLAMFLGQEAVNTCVGLWGSERALTALCTFFGALLPVAALFVFGTGGPRNAWGFSVPAASFVPQGDRIDVACSELADELGLTKREREVFSLIAKGYSRKFIGEQLVLSPETIKSYANKMYAKLGVHSRQDLIEMVNEHMAQDEEGR